MPENTLHFDVTSADFKQKVIDASHQAVIVVDFWAEWCGPCKMLGPVLEKIVNSFNGRVLLAKVDVDRNPDLGQLFRIQSIPAVKIFMDGEIVEEFMGALQEQQIRAILEPLAGSDEGDALELANRMLADGRTDEAELLYDEILSMTPDRHAAVIGKARVALSRKAFDKAESLLKGIGELEKEYDLAQSLLKSIEFRKVCAKSGDQEQYTRRITENPGDLEARYLLGCCQAAGDQYEHALESFLAVVSRDAGYGNGNAREAMVAIFNILGSDNEITRVYRNKLAKALF